jgi:hypothetical protein
VVSPSHVSNPRPAAPPMAMICDAISSRRRSTMSANAPPGRANRKMGSVVAAWIRATMSGADVKDVISQPEPASCIQVPTLDATVAIQSARNTGSARGLRADLSADDGIVIRD